MLNEVVIVGATRTPLGSFMGSLSGFSAVELGTFALNGAISKVNLSKDLIDEIFIGHVLHAGCGQAPARQIANKVNIKPEVPCTSVNRVCSSGLKAVTLAMQSIQLGRNDIVIAGGIESMSNTPHYMNFRNPKKYGNLTSVDGLIYDGLTDANNGKSMGVIADETAKQNSISRELQDNYALDSYNRAINATKNRLFDEEIIAIEYLDKNGNKVILDKDEQLSKVNFDKIPKLNPVFLKNGSITAANASPISDGASMLILMSRKKAIELNINPLAKIINYDDSSVSSELFTSAPSISIKKLLKRSKTKINSIDFFEINEAFAMVPLLNMDILSIERNKVNINGGAVSLGHPLGCSGARILTTLIHCLHQNNKTNGVASICNGGGGASSIQIAI